MLDIKYIRENVELMRKTLKDKQIDLDLDRLLELDEKRRTFLQEVEAMRNEKNVASKEIPKLEGEEKQALLTKMKEMGGKQDELEKGLKEVEEEYNKLMWLVPIPAIEGAIVGGEESNKELYKKGEIPQLSFTPKSHIELGKDLDIIDFDAGVKVMGTRGYFLKGKGATLEFALHQYALEFLREKGFTQMSVPIMADERFFYGTGHLPFGGDEVFLANDKSRDFGLVGTAEIPLCGYFADRTLEEKDLPQKVMAFSPCFRTEVGSYGKDTKGLYRVKQFYKVEQLMVVPNSTEASLKAFDELLENAEEFLTSLELPYRVLELATGDMGAGKYKMYDIETWMPSREDYGETHSCSALLDWQARRSNIRYKDAEGKKQYAHTLNNTIVATPRILIAVLELFQQEDGSIKVPTVLQKYCGFDVID